MYKFIYSNLHKKNIMLFMKNTKKCLINKIVSRYINNNIKQKLFRILLNLRKIDDEIKIGMSHHSYWRHASAFMEVKTILL